MNIIQYATTYTVSPIFFFDYVMQWYKTFMLNSIHFTPNLEILFKEYS